MKPNNKPAKKVVIRMKGKNTSMEHIKTESQQDLKKNINKDPSNKASLYTLNNNDSYTDLNSEDYRRTLGPKLIEQSNKNDLTFRQTAYLKNKEREKEKVPSLKIQNQKKEKDIKSPKGKKLINFNQKEPSLKVQQSERNIKKRKKKMIKNLKDIKLEKKGKVTD